MQFPVPQFIDIEDKIIGPFTLKQFGIIFGGGALILALFKIFQLGIITFVLGIPLLIVTLMLSFGTFNGKKVYNALPIFLKFLKAPKRLIFRHENPNMGDFNIQQITVESIQEAQGNQEVLEPASSRLKKLSILLDQKQQEEEEVLNKYQIHAR